MTRFDWPALMRAGQRGLRLSPREFWALTPAEFLLLLGHGHGDAPVNRARLMALEENFPDFERGCDDG